jgi:hypothetical protein
VTGVTGEPEHPLARLTSILEHEGGLMAAALRDPPGVPGEASGRPGDPPPSGPRTVGREPEYGLVLDAVREGYLLHYGAPRALSDEDPDLALLMGDRLYALGLAQLVELGDLDAVAELADLISLCATAHAAHDADLAQAAWEAARAAIAQGSDAPLAHAQRAARAAPPGSAARLLAAARERR